MRPASVTPALQVTDEGLCASEGLIPPGSIIDVLIDDHRVWSLSWLAEDAAGALVRWPTALRPHLRGRATLSIRLSATGDVVARQQVALVTDQERLTVTDENGHWLAVGKWGHLVPTFEGLGDLGDAVVQEAAAVVRALEAFGVQAFMCYGTLLGAVRNGDVLPHDDDFDLAYLSEHEHPADVAAEQLRVKRFLQSRFGKVISHSMGHLTVEIDTGRGTSINIDVFTAFHVGADLHLPFHVRVPRRGVALEPLTTLELRGVALPAPADPDALLSATYGTSWTTPDPSFKFQTPATTERRFTGWLGSFHHPARERWEGHYAAAATHRADSAEAPSPLSVKLGAAMPSNTHFIDVGAGDGQDAIHLASLGFRVTALDVARNAVGALEERAGAEGLPISATLLNLEDLSEVLTVIAWLDPDDPPCLLATDVVQHLSPQARSHLWVLLRAVAAAGGVSWVQTSRDSSSSVIGTTISAVRREVASHGLVARGAKSTVPPSSDDSTTWLEILFGRPVTHL